MWEAAPGNTTSQDMSHGGKPRKSTIRGILLIYGFSQGEPSTQSLHKLVEVGRQQGFGKSPCEGIVAPSHHCGEKQPCHSPSRVRPRLPGGVCRIPLHPGECKLYRQLGRQQPARTKLGKARLSNPQLLNPFLQANWLYVATTLIYKAPANTQIPLPNQHLLKLNESYVIVEKQYCDAIAFFWLPCNKYSFFGGNSASKSEVPYESVPRPCLPFIPHTTEKFSTV